jgi:hypothetical protein
MRGIAWLVMLLVVSGLPAKAEQPGGVEPQAGTWKTWVISSGPQFRVSPPPDRAATEKELGELRQMAATRDRAALDRVAYWDTGAPSYRWSEIAVAELLKNGTGWPVAVRDLALMHIAIYDALVAAWDSKYAYNRPHPSAVKLTCRRWSRIHRALPIRPSTRWLPPRPQRSWPTSFPIEPRFSGKKPKRQ